LGAALQSGGDGSEIQNVLLEQLGPGALDLKTLFIVLAYVRDIDGGMGERKMTYAMLDVWYQRFPVLAVYALEALVLCGYGSWRDVPGLCNYLKNFSVRRENHPWIETAVDFMLRHVHLDGLAAKWVPRETSKKNLWLFEVFVQRWKGGTTCTQENRRQFRRMISEKTRLPAAAVGNYLAPRFTGGHSLSSWQQARGPEKDAEWKRFAKIKFYPYDVDVDGDARAVLCMLPWQEEKKKTAVLVETLLLLEKMDAKACDVVLTTDPLSRITIRVADGFSRNLEKLMASLPPMTTTPPGKSFEKVLETLQEEALQPYFMLVVGGPRPSLYAVAAHPRYDPMRVLFDRITSS